MKKNTCYFCGGKLEKEKVSIARYWGKELVALRSVPSLVCQTCGERYFEAKTSERIDEKIQSALRERKNAQKITVPVIYF